MSTPTPAPAVSPCLWFDGDAEAAASFYAEVFPDSGVTRILRDEHGGALLVEFTVAGRSFQGLNGGPQFAGFTETVSFSIDCADQAEADYYWDTLAAGGEESMCGWLKDRFGLSWQVVPRGMTALLGDADPARARAAMQAMLQMRRLVVADAEAAADAARAPAPAG